MRNGYDRMPRTRAPIWLDDGYEDGNSAANTPGDKGGGAPATTNPQRIPVQVRECPLPRHKQTPPPASLPHRNLYIMFTPCEPAKTAR